MKLHDQINLVHSICFKEMLWDFKIEPNVFLIGAKGIRANKALIAFRPKLTQAFVIVYFIDRISGWKTAINL